jgi:hypothetical protein
MDNDEEYNLAIALSLASIDFSETEKVSDENIPNDDAEMIDICQGNCKISMNYNDIRDKYERYLKKSWFVKNKILNIPVKDFMHDISLEDKNIVSNNFDLICKECLTQDLNEVCGIIADSDLCTRICQQVSSVRCDRNGIIQPLIVKSELNKRGLPSAEGRGSYRHNLIELYFDSYDE